jgi:hypothetical protein
MTKSPKPHKADAPQTAEPDKLEGRAEVEDRKSKKVEVGRLALRHEGQWWNAYWAKYQDSMNEAILLGSIRINLAHGTAKSDFVVAMKSAFDNVVLETIGEKPTWSDPHPAPEDERESGA